MKPYRGKTKEGKRVEGWYCEVDGKHYIIPDDATVYQEKDDDANCICIHTYTTCLSGLVEIIPETVGQLIGFKDCKRTKEYPEGQETYGGDIVTDGKITTLAENYNWLGLSQSDRKDIEIIGNIHENPELIEEKE